MENDLKLSIHIKNKTAISLLNLTIALNSLNELNL